MTDAPQNQLPLPTQTCRADRVADSGVSRLADVNGCSMAGEERLAKVRELIVRKRFQDAGEVLWRLRASSSLPAAALLSAWLALYEAIGGFGTFRTLTAAGFGVQRGFATEKRGRDAEARLGCGLAGRQTDDGRAAALIYENNRTIGPGHRA